ncbi:endonuclease domain-containing protein [Mucilaginibacter sp.]|uniref:endonuclease domain-containing protein n=1 Tax=Mucilaginibacter sp. TaxID=1882438 RepID=UPI0026119B38|nr:endonuclease domain-containing protein [Mucilaginibacter sp.]MDB4925841.1 putative nucleotidyltransferase protein [Mucilaginibacter sp.]
MLSIKELCRELRQRQTPAEEILWYHLRNRNLTGKKFQRQYPLCVLYALGRRAYYIPDFYCHEAKLVIEADGPIHDFKKEYDKNRDEVMVSLGLSILRFSNDDIINQTQKVLDEIAQYIKNYPSLSS